MNRSFLDDFFVFVMEIFGAGQLHQTVRYFNEITI